MTKPASPRLPFRNQLEELQYRETFSFAAAAAIMVLAATLLLGQFNQFLNKAKMAEFYFFTTDFKVFVQERYAYNQTFPNRDQMAHYLKQNSVAKELHYLTLEDYGVTDNYYWFSFRGATASDITGKMTLSPHPVTDSGSIIWLCGDATHADIASTPTVTTTINRDYLVNICQ